MKSTLIVSIKWTSKILMALMAAFVLFMFIGEAFFEGGRQVSAIKKVAMERTYDLKYDDTIKGGTWSSSNSIIASVDSFTGVVKGISEGSVTIIHTTNKGTINTEVKVLPKDINRIKPRDYFFLVLMGIGVIGMLLVWWKERLGAWLSILTPLIVTIAVMMNNGAWNIKGAFFMIFALPSVALLLCSHFDKAKNIG